MRFDYAGKRAMPRYLRPVIFRVLISLLCFETLASAQQAARSTVRKETPQAPANAPDTTALGALKVIPKDAAEKLARIEARDGHPFPERWYILVHDPAQPRGLREFAVANGKLVAGRTLSQFADSISADEVIGADAVKVNSDDAAGIAAQFAMHNNVRLGTVQYELVRASAPSVPVWRLTCHGPQGETLGSIVLHATKGSLLGFQGFEKSPIVPDVAVADEPPPAEEQEDRPRTTTKPNKRTASSPSRSAPPRARPTSEPEAVRAVPVRRPPRQQGPVDRIGSAFRRVFRD